VQTAKFSSKGELEKRSLFNMNFSIGGTASINLKAGSGGGAGMTDELK